MPLPINISDLLNGHVIEHDRIEFKEGWNPDAIYRSVCVFANDIEKIGGPDRSIKSKAFKIGSVKPRRYRNRKLGDFLKELDLTEGKATGIPRIKKALKENGSPEPFFDFDEDRTFFEVDFYIHPAFNEKAEIPTTSKFTNTNKPTETLKESAMRVLSLIESNPQITAAEIAIKMGLSSRAVQKHIANLKALSMINRIGSDKSRYWEITKW